MMGDFLCLKDQAQNLHWIYDNNQEWYDRPPFAPRWIDFSRQNSVPRSDWPALSGVC